MTLEPASEKAKPSQAVLLVSTGRAKKARTGGSRIKEHAGSRSLQENGLVDKNKSSTGPAGFCFASISFLDIFEDWLPGSMLGPTDLELRPMMSKIYRERLPASATDYLYSHLRLVMTLAKKSGASNLDACDDESIREPSYSTRDARPQDRPLPLSID